MLHRALSGQAFLRLQSKGCNGVSRMKTKEQSSIILHEKEWIKAM